MPRWLKILLPALGLLALFCLGIGARRLIVDGQETRIGASVPFTLESALQYRRIKMIHDTGGLPAVDASIQYPEGVRPWATYEMGSEYLYALLARAWPGSMPVPERVRWIEGLWASLGAPLLALWVYAARRSVAGAGLAAVLYAICISAVLRSTGLELSRENFALPILVAHFAAAARARMDGRVSPGWAFLSAALLAWAQASWDMIQFVVGLKMIHTGWMAVRGRDPFTGARRRMLVLEIVGLMAVGLLHPYFRTNGYWFSPVIFLGFAALAAAAVRERLDAVPALAARRAGQAWLAVAAIGFLIGALASYGGSYGHFGELLWAKIRHLNVKPADPAELTFAQRIMWVPALHSASASDWRMLFPAMLYLTIPAFLLLWWQSRRLQNPETGQLLVLFGVSLVAFEFFVRFHVFTSLFGCAVLGFWVSGAVAGGGWRRATALVLMVVVVLVEASQTFHRPARWGRVNVYYKELQELATWLSQNVAPDPVLANFGVSGTIAAFGKCAILLHPKFEKPALRERVREYGEELFTGTEQSFRDWADQLGARYFVYANGEFATERPELQMRYFVNALNPRDDAPARLFEFHPDRLTLFRREWGNTKYSVFRMTTRADEAVASLRTAAARRALQAGDLDGAEQAAAEALEAVPAHTGAVEVLRIVGGLRDKGFQGPDAP